MYVFPSLVSESPSRTLAVTSEKSHYVIIVSEAFRRGTQKSE